MSETPPRLRYETRASLPPLAWCADARPGVPVRVIHGARVETREEGFVEGAWDGDFGACDFDRGAVLAGSGARRRGGKLVFVSPFHPLERLFVLRDGGAVRISNSLPFLLTESDDGLDLGHPDYFFDFLRHVRRGIAPVPATLPCASGRRVELHVGVDLALGADGALVTVGRPIGEPPADYATYRSMLASTMCRIAGNAADPRRAASYRLVAACSRGYDSTASSVVAAEAGCREGVTFVESATPSGHPIAGVTESRGDDSGADTLRRLGMRVREYDRRALAALPGHPRAEFFVSSPAAITDATARVMEDVLRDSVFVSGRHGERYWGPTRRCARLDFRERDDCHLSGQALGEFRLRAGFIHLPLPYIGARHGPAIWRITRSGEMGPWRLGTGYYDRPIPRRIAEEAGIPRESFGQRKLGAGMLSRELSPESEQDFQAFLKSQVPPDVLATLDPRPVAARLVNHRRLAYLRSIYSHWPPVGWALDHLGSDRLHMLWRSTALYHFHWGYAKTRERYLVR